MTQVSDAHALYQRTAEHWARREPSSLSDFTARPRVLAMCEPLHGKRVLDLGCGEGYCSRLMQLDGAQVHGIDVSERMIELASQAEAARPLGVRYETGDAAAADLGEGRFDLVLAMFLFNYQGVEQMRQTMASVHRTLSPGGHFVFAVPHPAFPFMREPAPPFGFEVGQAGYFSARDLQFSGRIWKRDGHALDVRLVHKTLGDYFDGLRRAGFEAMPEVTELGVTQDMIDLDADFFGPICDVPLHLAIKVKRH
jgi:SAM-dependent methyltransferase